MDTISVGKFGSVLLKVNGTVNRYHLAQCHPKRLFSTLRAIKQIQSLQSAVDQFPDANEDQTDTFALLDKMRAKFRVVTSVLKVEQRFSNTQPTGMSY